MEIGFFISRNHFEIEFIEQLDLNLGKKLREFFLNKANSA
ncbi:hypothetical protein LEP1GSC034_3346 [Leptospira interrogans str. 2003000735]|uniref:Uncharacterized protein n=4 Tax=Leptospira interrogans TaxID=173 RepID=A0A829D1E1_LEPIR|nr:hypothetical protein LEP1GSC045_0984 [Leptospira interrogans serovar Pomona str. Kennewicki LC82-25]EKN89872.1 hypothetical protein LEP1GSC027_3895 [Leptospira interrogans str. 2002000624]EKN96583.1 hypothetical protein LEP1GSC014_3757 [Leptospira interrogans serovar Pomona str. Pomona]EKO23346.1 hypothetical protein LEP1GSC104_0220 [Leptospira interrogans str. UI 12621]EKO68914.1 hypothetical protein LEP1GSC069_3995 [Leptospira interrogans serovar Canicola str. Fiocruz LV133]EKO87013.1 hyp